MNVFTILFIVFGSLPCWADVIVNNREEIQEYVNKGEHNQSFLLIDPSVLHDIQRPSGHNVDIDFGDDRVATVARVMDKNKVQANGTITELSCLPAEFKSHCQLHANFIIEHYRFVWKTHPEANKIGEVVRLGRISHEFPEGSTPPPIDPILQKYVWYFESQFEKFKSIRPKNIQASTLQPPQIQCDSHLWSDELAKMFGTKNSHFTIDDWTAENMFQNPETGIAVNTTIADFFGVQLGLSADHVSIENIEFMANPLGPGIFGESLFLGDVIGWSLQSSNNYCEVAWTFDTGAFQEAFIKSQDLITSKNMEMLPMLEDKIFTDLTESNWSQFKRRFGNLQIPPLIELHGRFDLLGSPNYLYEDFKKPDGMGGTETVQIQIQEFKVRKVAP